MADDASSQDPIAAADASMSATQAAFTTDLVIPDDVRAQFPELVELIVASESMNDEERQYWVNILPIMTPEQVQNLRDILVNERDQLAAIDAKYDQAASQISQEDLLLQTEEQRREKAQKRKAAETEAETEEERAQAELLKKIEGIGE